jgi:hypothetical protein
MADIVRHGTIIIDLKAGKQDLAAPDLSKAIAAQKQHVELQQQHSVAAAEAKTKQEALASAVAKHAAAEEDLAASTLKAWNSEMELVKATKMAWQEEDKAVAVKEKMIAATRKQETASVAQEVQQKRTTETVQRLSINQANALREVGEGAFVVARSIALMSSGTDGDLQKMVRNVAAVQAGFDLFRGSSKVIQGLTMALGASQAATAALMKTLNPYLAIVGAIAGGYALLTARMREANEAQEEENRLKEEALEFERELHRAQQDRLKDAKDRIKESKFDALSPEEQLREFRRREQQAESRLRIQQRALENDPFSQRKKIAAAEAEANVLDIREDVRRVDEVVEREREQARREITSNLKEVADAISGFKNSVVGELLGVQRRQGFFEQALGAFKN